MNFRRIGSDAYGLLPVGQISLRDGIEIDMSKMKAYTENKTEIPLADVSSKCISCLAAQTKPTSAHFLQVNLFLLAYLLLLHLLLIMILGGCQLSATPSPLQQLKRLTLQLAIDT